MSIAAKLSDLGDETSGVQSPDREAHGHATPECKGPTGAGSIRQFYILLTILVPGLEAAIQPP